MMNPNISINNSALIHLFFVKKNVWLTLSIVNRIYFLFYFFVCNFMKSFWNRRRTIYGGIVLLSALIVFFTWWTFNSEKMGTEFSFLGDGVTHFRKWLDVSGGTRLMYRISYDTYEQTYSGNTQALNDIKATVENIILKNIDGRISKLWVSDYKSYTQQLDNETQIVVEIWWVADLDQAKELIGKTVELEFKLPNDSEWSQEEKAERKTLAQDLYSDLLDKTDKFEAIADSRQSENVLYNKYDRVTLSQLPTIYHDNLWVLDETQEWKVSPLMEWEYYSYQYQDESGNVQNVDMNGYTFFHMISKEKWVRTWVELNDILEVATKLWATYDEKFTLVKEWTDVASGSYVFEWNILKYNNGEVYPNEAAYDVRILAMIPEVSVSAETGSTETEESDDEFQTEVDAAKTALLADADAEIDESSPVYDWVISNSSLKEAIPSFDANNTEEVQVYEEEWFTYLVVLRWKKAITDHWYNFAMVNWVSEDEFNKALESQTFYTIEEVFVQDRLTWKNAQSEDGKILNGANFKYAAVGNSQLWQPVVLINFNDEWKKIFCSITENNIWKQMAIFIWWEMITSPVIQARICDGSAQIDGNFTPDSAKELTDQLNDWALPAPLVLMQEEKVSPTLWENALNGALVAMAIGFVAIWLYMTFMYGWRKWLVSLISLSIYTLVLFAIVKLFDYALSLKEWEKRRTIIGQIQRRLMWLMIEVEMQFAMDRFLHEWLDYCYGLCELICSNDSEQCWLYEYC